MRKDPTEFRKRFKAYLNGKSPYKNGRPIDDDEEEQIIDGGLLKEVTVTANRPTVLDQNKGFLGITTPYSARKFAESLGGYTKLVGNKKITYIPNTDNDLHRIDSVYQEHLDNGDYRNDKYSGLSHPRPHLGSSFLPNHDQGKLPKYDTGEPEDNPWIPKGTKVNTKNSEPLSAKPTTTYIGDDNQPVETAPVYQEPINPQTGRPYTVYEKDLPLSGTDPIGLMIVEGAALNPVFKGLGWLGSQAFKKALPYIGRATKSFTNYFAAKVLANEIDDAVMATKLLPPLLNGALPNIGDVYKNVWYLPNDFKIKGNFINRINTQQQLDKYGKLYNAEKEANDFLIKDVYPRFKRNVLQNIGSFSRMTYDGSSGIPHDLNIFYADYSKTPYGGMQLYNNKGVPYITIDPNFRNTSRVLTHELEHYFTALREKGFELKIPHTGTVDPIIDIYSALSNAKTRLAYSDITPTGKTVEQLLDDGYKFDNTPKYAATAINRLKEKAATNREIRLRISLLNGNVYFEDLDNVIDNMSDEELLNILQTENGYSNSFYRELQNIGNIQSKVVLQNMRQALKYAPLTIPFFLGGSTLDEHDKGKSIHIKTS